jgi:hypothetical protein
MLKTKLCKNVTEIGTFSIFTHVRKISLLVLFCLFLKTFPTDMKQHEVLRFSYNFFDFFTKKLFLPLANLALLTNFKAKRA